MVVMIVAVDRLFGRPVVVWAQKFRLDDSAGEAPARSWVLEWLRRARLRRQAGRVRRGALRPVRIAHQPIRRSLRRANRVLRRMPRPLPPTSWLVRISGWALLAGAAASAVWGAWRVAELITRIDRAAWGTLGIAAGLTFARVLLAVALSPLWAVPPGVLIGRSPPPARVLQPIIQVIASFPAPILFPLGLLVLAPLGVRLGLGRVAPMTLSAQWS